MRVKPFGDSRKDPVLYRFISAVRLYLHLPSYSDRVVSVPRAKTRSTTSDPSALDLANFVDLLKDFA